MKMAVFSTKPYDREFLHVANCALAAPHRLVFLEPRLSLKTAVLADGADAVCLFVNDVADAPVLEALAALGVQLIALHSAGFNNVDLVAAGRLGLHVARVPAYSPESVAEYTLAMMLALNLGNFLRTLVLPEAVSHWSMTTLRDRLVKIGAKIVRHGRSITFQMAEVMVPRALFQQILDAITALRPLPPARC